jgi:hypothetical protein
MAGIKKTPTIAVGNAHAFGEKREKSSDKKIITSHTY